MHDIVIIGGGIAGLSAANTLVDHTTVPPLLIEAGSYPAHKICGEFISPECLPILDQWGLRPATEIKSITLSSQNKSVSIPLPMPASTQARYVLDAQLAQRAIAKGATILTKTRVNQMQGLASHYELHLSTGEMICAKKIIVGTGRIACDMYKNTPTMQHCYVGIKMHLAGIKIEHELLMHILPKGGYVGLVPISLSVVNVAALLPLSLFQDVATEDYCLHFLQLCPAALREMISQAVQIFYAQGHTPKFGIKDVSYQPHAYFIGDAAGTIPPASGAGLAVGLSSGCMAARYAMNNEYKAFRRDWKRRYHRQFFVAQCLHHLMLSPTTCSNVLKLCRLFPSLALQLFQLTRTNI